MANTDPTLQVLHDLSRPEKWDKVVRSVPIFIEHSRNAKTPDGKTVTVKVDKARLEGIMRRIQSRQRGSAVLLKGIDGHTLPAKGTPQSQQPDILCYYANPRIGRWGPQRKIGLLVDQFIPKGGLARCEGYPFRSPEFYARELGGDDDITGVALLKTDPALDMGMITYEQTHRVLLYAMGDDTMPPDMGDDQDADMGDKKPDPTDAPDADEEEDKDGDGDGDGDQFKDLPPSTDGLDQGTHDNLNRYMKQHGHHLLKYMQGCSKPGVMKAEDNDDEAENYMSAKTDTDAIHYQRVEKRLKALEERNDRLAVAYKREKAKGRVLSLVRDHGLMVYGKYADKLVDRFVGADEKEWPEMEEEARVLYRADPAAGGIPDEAIFGGTVESGEVAGSGDPDKISDKQLEAALQYSREHPDVDFEAALEKTRGQAR